MPTYDVSKFVRDAVLLHRVFEPVLMMFLCMADMVPLTTAK